LAEDGLYARTARQAGLADHEYLAIDAKTRVYDTYRERTAIEENLAAQLTAAALLLAAREPLPDGAPRREPHGGVLVYGGGVCGLRVAAEVANLGLVVDLVSTGPQEWSRPGGTHGAAPLGALAETLDDPAIYQRLSDDVRRNKRVAILSVADLQPAGETVPPSVTPTESGFLVSVGGTTREYGAIVYAPDPVEESPPEVGAWSLTQLYTRLIAATGGAEPVKGRIVFVLDHAHGGNAPEFRDVLVASRHLKERRAEVLVLLQHARVALPGLEELYDSCRDAGVVFLRHEGLRVRSDYGDFTITGRDAQSGAAFTLVKPDHVVIPGSAALGGAAAAVAAGLGLRLIGGRYGQPDSLWGPPSGTNRPGLYVAGCAQAEVDAAGILRSAALAAAGVWERFALGPGEKEHIAVVDGDKCAFCLTCVRVCPFGAVVPDIARKAASVVRAACQACGVCAAECPAEAIEMRNLTRRTVASSIAALVNGRSSRVTSSDRGKG
jgi:heterodisulfide reductase subunit A-like polyferredoxin